MEQSTKRPLISVLMCVYNGDKYLKEAIDSIIGQTYTDFEFIIVNDGSTDSSRDIILSCKDPRIVYVENNVNLGFATSLNRGLAKAKCEFIARMDADDVSLPDRFATQMEIMQTYKVDICGTAMQIMDSDGNITGMMGFKNIVDSDLPSSILDNSTPLLHPTIMMKRTALEDVGGYNPDMRPHDFDLWARMFLARKKAIVIPATLVQYRQHPFQITEVLRESLFHYGCKVIKEYISSLLGDKATEHASSLFIFFLIPKPDFVKKQIPNINLSEIFSFRRIFHQRFIHINDSLIGLDKRIANSAKYILKSSQSSLWMRIKMLYLYWLANLSVYHQEGSIVKALSRKICKLLHGLAKRLFKFFVTRNNYRIT